MVRGEGRRGSGSSRSAAIHGEGAAVAERQPEGRWRGRAARRAGAGRCAGAGDRGRGWRRRARACRDGGVAVELVRSAISTMRPRYMTATRSAMCSHHREVVRDEEHGETEVGLQISAG